MLFKEETETHSPSDTLLVPHHLYEPGRNEPEGSEQEKKYQI